MLNFKIFINTTLPPIVLCLALTTAVPALAKKGLHQTHDGMQKILSELSLTDAQKQDIKQILKHPHKKRTPFTSEAKALETELRDLVQSSEWDQTAVENAIYQRHSLTQTRALQRATNRNQIWNILTDSQQTEFVAQLDNRKAKREEFANTRKGMRKDKKLKHLNLTDDQLTAVEAIKAAAKENSQETKEELLAYREAERALVQSTEFDIEAWQTLNSEYQEDFVTLAVLKAKTKYEIWNQLTLEQQAEARNKHDKKSKWKQWKRT